MSLPIVVFISGISGVFLVMTFLLIMVMLGSKLAMTIEKKKEPTKQNLS
ncbi:MAG TPA: oxaloacetate decarboxylase subunit gamma [Desulfosporosinus sp.]|nr:oxaloacetate decarboxylase subunit gamma [Desulfosporosinus sp.]